MTCPEPCREVLIDEIQPNVSLHQNCVVHVNVYYTFLCKGTCYYYLRNELMLIKFWLKFLFLTVEYTRFPNFQFHISCKVNIVYLYMTGTVGPV